MSANLPLSTPAGRLRLAGFVVLLIGLLAAVWVYVAAGTANGQDASGYQIIGGTAYATDADSAAREMQQVERLGGTAAVLTVKFHRWLGSLWHGRRLALTLTLLSCGAAFLCFHIAGLMSEKLDD